MKNIIPYALIFFSWLVLSLIGNVYQDYDNNLELNVGRISECFKKNEIYLYANNQNKTDVSLNYNVIVTSTDGDFEYNISFDGNDKKFTKTIEYTGSIKSITVDGNILDYSNAKMFNNKFVTFILRYSTISLIICFIIVYLIIEAIKKTKKKYIELNSIRNDFINTKEAQNQNIG